MDVVVDVFPSNYWCYGVGFLSGAFCPLTLKLHALLLETCFDCLLVAVMVLTVLNRNDVVAMLFWKDLTILNWLYRSVVMVLMHLTVDGSLGFFVANFGNVLVYDGWCNLLMNCGVVVTSLMPKKCNVSQW